MDLLFGVHTEDTWREGCIFGHFLKWLDTLVQ